MRSALNSGVFAIPLVYQCAEWQEGERDKCLECLRKAGATQAASKLPLSPLPEPGDDELQLEIALAESTKQPEHQKLCTKEEEFLVF